MNSMGRFHDLRRLSAGVSACLLALLLSIGSAASEVKVQPADPTEDDDIRVLVSVPCKTLVGKRVLDPGQRIIVVVVSAKQCGKEPGEVQQKLGRLAPGDYRLHVKVEGESESFQQVPLRVKPSEPPPR
jgi:hypothetical protein